MPTGKKHTNVGWDDGRKIGKIIIISHVCLETNYAFMFFTIITVSTMRIQHASVALYITI